MRASYFAAALVALSLAGCSCSNTPSNCASPCGDACCASGEACVNGVCGCTPQCAGRECGDDGCGGSCGGCGEGLACDATALKCVSECGTDAELCEAHKAQCGPLVVGDRCNTDRRIECGSCLEGEACNNAHQCCLAESDAKLCTAHLAECGALVVQDSCGATRRLDCGTCPAYHDCDTATHACGPCHAESDDEFCASHQVQCASLTATDRCGETRTVASCGRCEPFTLCDPNGRCKACQVESDAQLCQRLNVACGPLETVDLCEIERSVLCGNCAADHVCEGGVCRCVPETDDGFCARQHVTCGAAHGTDNCGSPRDVASCGTCLPQHLCTAGSCVCQAESNTALCTRLAVECGTTTAVDNCGRSRTVSSCGSCPSGQMCDTGHCRCAPESDAAICSRRTVRCGPTGDTDNCGTYRTVANCGTCTSPMTCDQGTCRCIPETNDAMCARRGVNCGPLSGPDNCGTARAIASCGSCTAPEECLSGTCGVCVPETDAAFCARLNAQCASFSGVDNCRTPRTVANCGTCASPTLCGSNNRCTVPPVTNCVSPQLLTFDASGVATVSSDTAGVVNVMTGSCAGSGPDLLFAFTTTALKVGTVDVAPAAGSALRPVVYLRRTCAQPDTEAVCAYSYDAGTTTHATLPILDAGTWYLFVDGFNATRGPFTLTVTLQDPPVVAPNRTCAFPQELTFDAQGVASACGDTRNSTNGFDGSCNTFTGPDLVYSFTLTDARPVAVSLAPDAANPDFAPGVYVRRSCASAAASDEIRCAWGSPTRLALGIQPAGTYYVIVDAAGSDAGRFTLEVTATASPSNDNCSNPMALTLDARGRASVQGDTTLGKNDYLSRCSSQYAGPDLVYSLTLTQASEVRATVTASPADSYFYPALYMRAGTCAIAQDNCAQSSSSVALLTSSSLSAGTYYYFVDGSSYGRFTLDIRTEPAVSSSTGRCPGELLTLDAITGRATVTGSNAGVLSTATSSCGGSGPEHLYRFTTPAAGFVDATVTPAPGSTFTPIVYLTSYCPSSSYSSVSSTCASGASGGPARLIEPGLSAAATYYLYVDSASSDGGDYTLEVHFATPAPPANDTCTSPQLLVPDASGLATVSGSTIGARNDYFASCPSGTWSSRGPDVVYALTTTAETLLSAKVRGTTVAGYTPLVSIRRTCSDLASEIACDSNASGHLPIARAGTVPAGTYYVLVDSGGDEGMFDLEVHATLAPANDRCAGAQPIAFDAQGHASATGSTRDASNDYSGTCAIASGPDLVYSVTTSAPSILSANLRSMNSSDSSYAPALYLRSACTDPAAQIGCDNGSGYGVFPGLVPTGTWYLFVDSTKGFGDFTLNVFSAAATLNDTCTSPQALVFDAAGVATAAGDLSLATGNERIACTSYHGNDVLYSFTTSDMRDILVRVTADFGAYSAPGLAVRRSCGDATTELACKANDSYSSSQASVSLLRLSPGTYYVVVQDDYTGGGFTLTVTSSAPSDGPANDSCANATALAFDANSKAIANGTTTGAAADFVAGCAATSGYGAGGDVAYSFTLTTQASITAAVTPVPSNSSSALIVMLRSSCGDDLRDEVACGHTAYATLQPGTYYAIVKHVWDYYAEDFRLELTRGTAVAADSCANPGTLTFNAQGAATATVNPTTKNDNGSGSCPYSSSAKDAVYAFTLTSESMVSGSLSSGTSGSPVVYVRSVCDSRVSELACAAYSSGTDHTARFSIARLPAGTYYVFVDAVSDYSANFTLTVQADPIPAAPANDRCAGAQVLAFDPLTGRFSVTGDTRGGADDYRGTCSDIDDPLNGPEVVFQFSLPVAANFGARVTADPATPTYAPAVYVRSACESTARYDERFCQGYRYSGSIDVTLGNLAAGTYFLFVDGFSGGAGRFTLSGGISPLDSNETCDSPLPLVFDGAGVAVVAGDPKFGTSDELQARCYSSSLGDLVYSFALAQPRDVDVAVNALDGQSGSYGVYVRSTCSDTLTELGCKAPPYPAAPTALSLSGLMPGTYYVVVESSYSAPAYQLKVTARARPTPPSNDSCANPQNLAFNASGAASVTATTAPATDDYSGTCGAMPGPDLAYRIVLSQASSITATITPDTTSTSIQFGMYLRRSCASAALSDEAGCLAYSTYQHDLRVGYLPAGTWYLVVDSARPAGFTLSVQTGTARPGDGCLSPIPLALGTSGEITVTGDSSTMEHSGEGRCMQYYTSGLDMVYSFDVPRVSKLDVSVQPTTGSSFEPAVYLRSTCNDPASEPPFGACTYQYSGTGAVQLHQPRLAAGTWYLWVGSIISSYAGPFSLHVQLADADPTPANDDCSGAVALTFDTTTNTATASGDTSAATNQMTGTCGDGSGPELVYRLSTTAHQKVTFSTTASSFAPMIYLRSSCALGASERYCHTSSGTAVINDLAPGTWYLVVDGVGSSWGAFSVGVTLAAPVAGPANDGCSTAQPLTFVGNLVSVAGTTVDALDDGRSYCSYSGADVVYYFDLSTPRSVDVIMTPDAAATGWRPVLAMRRTCWSVERDDEVGCTDAMDPGGTTLTMHFPNLAAGTYYLWIDSDYGTQAQGAFALTLRQDVPVVPPANDTCAGAVALGLNVPVAGTTASATANYGAAPLSLQCVATATIWMPDGPEVVYSYTPASSGPFTVRLVPAAGFDPLIWVTTGACGTGAACVAMTDAAAAGATETLTLSGVAGQTYFLMVDSFSTVASTGSGAFTIVVN